MKKELRPAVIKESCKLISEAHLKGQAEALGKVAMRLNNGAKMLDYYMEADILGAEEVERLVKKLELNINRLDTVKDMLESAKDTLEYLQARM